MDAPLTPNFWLSEFLRSDVAERLGIDNTPGPEDLARIRTVLAPGMQRIRDDMGVALFILSGYRSPVLNAAVKGARTSQHCQGLAADFTASRGLAARSVALYLSERIAELQIDQLIYEGSWVHVSFTPGKPRNQILTARFVNGVARYSTGLTV